MYVHRIYKSIHTWPNRLRWGNGTATRRGGAAALYTQRVSHSFQHKNRGKPLSKAVMCASVSPVWIWLRVPDWMFPFLWVHSCYRTFERKGKYNITLRYPLKDPNTLNHSVRLVFPWHLTTDIGDYASVFLGKPLWMKLVPDAKFAQAAPWVVIVIAVKLLCDQLFFQESQISA